MNNPKNNSVLSQAIIDSLQKQEKQLHGRRVWLACSGGRDSLSLALVCRQLFDDGILPFLPQLLHVNHGMQQANEQWAAKVKQWALAHQMHCQIIALDAQPFSSQKLDDTSHTSIVETSIIHNEQSARKARYQAMMTKMNEQDVLMLGHHQDDQVETVLMRLFNGAGVKGLGGMKEWTQKTTYSNKPDSTETYSTEIKTAHSIQLWRPWLSISRAQISQFAAAVRLDYIDDPTNIIKHNAVNPDATNPNASNRSIVNQDSAQNPLKSNDRAWIRSELMPKIQERYPNAYTGIVRSSELMQSADTILTKQAMLDLNTVLVFNRYQTENRYSAIIESVLKVNELLMLTTSRQANVLHYWLTKLSTALPPSKRLIDDTVELCHRQDSDHNTLIHWDSGLKQYNIQRHQNKLYCLNASWQLWLQVSASTQRHSLSFSDSNPFSTSHPYHIINDSDYLNLKPNDLSYTWQILGVSMLTSRLRQQLTRLKQDDCDSKKNEQVQNSQNSQSSCIKNSYIKLEALPRDLKMTLAGRVGRKSGKKLFQALEQPVFMRPSVVLASIVYDDKTVPLFIITINQIHLLQSPFSNVIKMLLNNGQLSLKGLARHEGIYSLKDVVN